MVVVEKKLPDKSLLLFPLLRRDSSVWPASWRRHWAAMAVTCGILVHGEVLQIKSQNSEKN